MAAKANSASDRRHSATAVLQLLDHLRGMARTDGHAGMAEALDDAYHRCLRVESAERAARRVTRIQAVH